MSSQEFRQMVRSDNLPWVTNNMPWTDSVKEQYFSMLNAEAANQHELEMWRLNNEYNTPEKQMERMIQAGINPAAAYDKVSTGTSSSAPGVHESKTPSWHDTSDKLQQINTIMNGVSQLVSSVGSAVGSVSGIQDIALKHQNNWYNELRSNLFHNFNQNISTDPSRLSVPYELAPGLYAEATAVQLYPELFKGFKSEAYATEIKQLMYKLSQNADQRAQGIYEKQMQVNNLLDDLMKKLDQPEIDFGAVFKDILKMTLIQSLRRY